MIKTKEVSSHRLTQQLLLYLIVCTPKEHRCHNNNWGVRIHLTNVNGEIQQHMIVTNYITSQLHLKHNKKNNNAMLMPPTPSQMHVVTRSLDQRYVTDFPMSPVPL